MFKKLTFPSKRVLRHAFISFLIEFSPILVFVFSYKYLHIYKDTFLLMIMTIISTFFAYIKEKRIPYVGLYVALLTIIFGYITIAYRIPKFIQIRDTFYDLTFALTLAVGLLYGKVFFKDALNTSIPMLRESWIKVTQAWVVFFIACAIMNEFIRRNFSIHAWIQYKMIMIFVSILFAFIILVSFYKPEPKH